MKKLIIISSIFLSLVLLTACACKTGKTASVSKESITSTGWELSKMNGKDVTAMDFPNGMPNAIFTSDDKISGNGGCNRYGGSYTLDAESKLTLSKLISTKMFCQGVAEDSYLKALNRANRAKIEGNNLTLYFENEPVLVFVPKKLD